MSKPAESMDFFFNTNFLVCAGSNYMHIGFVLHDFIMISWVITFSNDQHTAEAWKAWPQLSVPAVNTCRGSLWVWENSQSDMF